MDRRLRVGVQRDAGIKMQRTFSAEAKAVLADGGVSGITAVEKISQSLRDPCADALT